MRGSEDPYSKALDLLTRRDHTCAELADKLRKRGFEQLSVDETLAKLSAQGLLDDARFAERWVASALRNGRGFGTKLLLELQRKGVDRETARQAVAASAVENPAEQVLAELIRKKFADFDYHRATQKERARIYNYLQRRGFQFATITGYFNNELTESEG